MRQSMANQRKSNQRRRGSPAPQRRSRRRRTQSRTWDLTKIFGFRKDAEFKPDNDDPGIWKVLHITYQQRLDLLRWGLYIAVVVAALMIQDVIMSQVTIFGSTTDLVVCAILLITVIEGTEVGSLFVIIASTLYFFSGSSPGPFAIGFLTVYGIGACMFRQIYWHRSQGSIVLCASLALMLYEISVFGAGIFLKLTRWNRIGTFLITGALSCVVMVPLYNLIHAIGQIGGHTWKE